MSMGDNAAIEALALDYLVLPASGSGNGQKVSTARKKTPLKLIKPGVKKRVEDDWLQQNLASALSIPTDAVTKFIFHSKENGGLISELFCPKGPGYTEIASVESKFDQYNSGLPSNQEEKHESIFLTEMASSPRGERCNPLQMQSLRIMDAEDSDGEESTGTTSTCSSSSSIDMHCFKQLEDIKNNCTGDSEYLQACDEYCIHPISYFFDNLCSEHVCLARHFVGKKGCLAISKALRHNIHIASLSLAGCNIEKNGAISLGDVLRTNTSLVSLDLGGNLIGTSGAQALAQALETNRHLKKLALKNNKIGDQFAKTLCQTILEFGNNTLRILDLSYNNISEKGASAIGEIFMFSDTLSELDLAWNNIRGKGATTILSSLATSGALTLEKLNMSWNGVDDRVAEALGLAISTCQGLVYLDLSHNGLGCKTVQAVSESIILNTSLRSLQLGFNPLGAGVYELLRAMEINSQLRHLGLENTVTAIEKNAFGQVQDIDEVASQVMDKRGAFVQILTRHPPIK